MIQFVKQSVVPLGPCPSDEAGMLKRIELCGRVAYKSEDKITEDSAIGFVQRMKKSGHLSVLEHSNICLLMRHSVDDVGYFWRLFKERGRETGRSFRQGSDLRHLETGLQEPWD